MEVIPSGFNTMRMPSTKSLRSGTWASTLLPTTRSAWMPSVRISSAVSTPKNSAMVGMPFARAASATFWAGSMPSTGTPLATKCWRR